MQPRPKTRWVRSTIYSSANLGINVVEKLNRGREVLPRAGIGEALIHYLRIDDLGSPRAG